jgi:hypothetical protein
MPEWAFYCRSLSIRAGSCPCDRRRVCLNRRRQIRQYWSKAREIDRFRAWLDDAMCKDNCAVLSSCLNHSEMSLFNTPLPPSPRPRMRAVLDCAYLESLH